MGLQHTVFSKSAGVEIKESVKYKLNDAGEAGEKTGRIRLRAFTLEENGDSTQIKIYLNPSEAFIFGGKLTESVDSGKSSPKIINHKYEDNISTVSIDTYDRNRGKGEPSYAHAIVFTKSTGNLKVNVPVSAEELGFLSALLKKAGLEAAHVLPMTQPEIKWVKEREKSNKAGKSADPDGLSEDFLPGR